MEMEITRTKKEVEKLIEECSQYQQKGTSKYRGQTYEDGIRNAIDWLVGDSDDYPME